MTQPAGQLVGATIRPLDDTMTIATTWANEAKGGHHQVIDIAARDAIPAERRLEDMLVTVLDDSGAKNVYTLFGGITNSDWSLAFPAAPVTLATQALTIGVPTTVDSLDLAGLAFVKWQLSFISPYPIEYIEVVGTYTGTGVDYAFGLATSNPAHTIIVDDSGGYMRLRVTPAFNVALVCVRQAAIT